MRYFSERAGVTIVVDQELVDKTLTVSLADQPFDEALRLVCRLAGAEINRVGGAYALGKTRQSDQVARVFRVRGDPQAMQAALAAVGVGRQARLRQDGTVLVVGSVDELRRAERAIAAMQDTTPGQWHVQLFLVTMTNRDLADLGLDISPSASVGASFRSGVSSTSAVSGSTTGALPGVSAAAGLSTVLRAARERSTIAVAARPEFLLLDGGKGTFTRGAEILLPKRAVSGQGTITTTDFVTIQTGTTVNVTAREVAASVVQLSLDVQLSELQEITSEGTPVTNRRSYSDVALAAHGSEVLCGSFEVESQRRANGHWLHAGMLRDTSYEILQVWARVEYLGTPAACGPELITETFAVGPELD